MSVARQMGKVIVLVPCLHPRHVMTCVDRRWTCSRSMYNIHWKGHSRVESAGCFDAWVDQVGINSRRPATCMWTAFL